MLRNLGVEPETQLQYVSSISIIKCRVIEIGSSCLWWHKQLCKPFLCQLMDESQSFEDKDESIWIPYAVNMQPIKKLEGIKWKNELSGKMNESQP